MDKYEQENRFFDASLMEIRMAPRQFCGIHYVEELADEVMKQDTELEQLRAELEATKRERDEYKADSVRCAAAHLDAVGKLTACQDDAERYKWFRQHAPTLVWVTRDDFTVQMLRIDTERPMPFVPNELDAAIDAAMKGDK